jgi:pimeloyl-ACP methyl ester carboxylesterase
MGQASNDRGRALMHHVRAGAGAPAVVFVHGFACSHADWRAQAAHLAPRHATVSVDLPGHGATPAGAEASSIEGLGRELARLLGALALPPAVLVGHSMGCRVVLEAALLQPSRVAGVVLVDGSRFAAGAAAAFEARFAAGEYAAAVRGMFEQMFTSRSDPAVKAAVVERAMTLPAPLGQALLLSLARYDEDRLERALERVGKPLMVLQTTYTNDRRERVPLRAGQTTPYLDFVRSRAPQARIEVIADTGHFPQLDAAAETNRLLASFAGSLA